MTTILTAIDPGTESSGVVDLDVDVWPPTVLGFEDATDNREITETLGPGAAPCLAIEMIASYGMPVGEETFNTCVWIGRFVQAAMPIEADLIPRLDVKMALCHDSRAKDANIRRAILDLYPATGGGKTPQVGTKKKPGPLYGVKSHSWAALAVGLTWCLKRRSDVR